MSAWTHTPILAAQIADMLITKPEGVYLDATLGLGGHSKIFMARLGPKGRIIGIDKDKKALDMAAAAINDGRLSVFNAGYLDAPQIMARAAVSGFDGALFDLGLSSYQLDDASRGFSFVQNGPLDMRFDNTSGITAADIVNDWPVDKIEEILLKYGEERAAHKIALTIYEARKTARIANTLDLARIVESVLPRSGKTHPATKTFQALRIAVNDELSSVEKLPQMLPKIILPGGRAAVLTFHSAEDRIIKYAFKALADTGAWQLVNKKVIEPSYEEIRANPRARSAKLRVIERL